jgi:hypothetical protein
MISKEKHNYKSVFDLIALRKSSRLFVCLTNSTALVIVVETLLHFHLVLAAYVLNCAQNAGGWWHASKTELLIHRSIYLIM